MWCCSKMSVGIAFVTLVLSVTYSTSLYFFALLMTQIVPEPYMVSF